MFVVLFYHKKLLLVGKVVFCVSWGESSLFMWEGLCELLNCLSTNHWAH